MVGEINGGSDRHRARGWCAGAGATRQGLVGDARGCSLSSVFGKLGAVEILMGSRLHAAGLPELWRSVDMATDVVEKMDCDALRAMAKVAVHRSGGQLEVFFGKSMYITYMFIWPL